MNRERCPEHNLLVIPALGKCGKCAQLDDVRSARGRARQLGGQTKEQLVDKSLAVYAKRGEALIYPVPPPIVGAPGRMRYAGLGPFDRMGRWGAIPIAFDVKGVTGRSSYEHDVVKAGHQLQNLLDFGEHHQGIAFLLLVDSTLELMWVLDDREQLSQLLYYAASVPIRRSKKGALEHLLPVVRPETDLLKIAKGAPEYDFLAVLRSLDRVRNLPVA